MRMIPNANGGVYSENGREQVPDGFSLTHSCTVEWRRARTSVMGMNNWTGNIVNFEDMRGVS
jgi:hypothetical protein